MCKRARIFFKVLRIYLPENAKIHRITQNNLHMCEIFRTFAADFGNHGATRFIYRWALESDVRGLARDATSATHQRDCGCSQRSGQ